MDKHTYTRMRQMVTRSCVQFNKGPVGEYSDEFYTPPRIVAALGPFDLDPCAGPMSHAARNLRREDDGLAQPWAGRVWLNPPYSNVHEWLEKFYAHRDGIVLVNARPDAKWFQRLARDADAVLWLQGRIEFERPEGKKSHAPVGSVLVAYGQHNAEALRKSGLPGIVMRVAHCIPNNMLTVSGGRKGSNA